MASISLLTDKLIRDFPQFSFAASQTFHWSPPEKTIFFNPIAPDNPALLHELSHAILDHQAYRRDIELIAMERDAWQYAVDKLSRRYQITISGDIVQEALDSYRDWLHARSLCPFCEATGIQTTKTSYKCVACIGKWTVNEARSCSLRRYKLK